MTTISDIRRIYPDLVEQDTGGGCMALLHPCADGGHLLLSVGEGEVPSDDDTVIDCGVYDGESNLVGDVDSVHVDRLREWIETTLAARAAAKT